MKSHATLVFVVLCVIVFLLWAVGWLAKVLIGLVLLYLAGCVVAYLVLRKEMKHDDIIHDEVAGAELWKNVACSWIAVVMAFVVIP